MSHPAFSITTSLSRTWQTTFGAIRFGAIKGDTGALLPDPLRPRAFHVGGFCEVLLKFMNWIEFSCLPAAVFINFEWFV